MGRLRRSDTTGPGLSRRRYGRGFSYFDATGARVRDPDTLARIDGLVIPPAWKQVWICPWPNGHIQATGVDARGRTQYRYHDRWRVHQDREKFDHMVVFARALPTLRARVESHLGGEDLGRERVLACATRLLDLGFFRIGSDCYAEENQTYGLATMLKRHVQVRRDTVSFDFEAKGGKRRIQTIVDPEVASVVAALARRRSGGDELLAWRRIRTGAAPGAGRAGRARWVDVSSDDINAYIREQAGIDCSAKDFRTWNATVLAAVALSVCSPSGSPATRQRRTARAMNEVAHYLGNTPAVVRRSYVDPRVVDRFARGQTIASALGQLGEGTTFGQLSTQGAIEEAVLDLLDPVGEGEVAA
ncbi:MAG TPA: hypothetical protein VG184_08090 [Acidimicrobiales bacterium]|nr:hypothetical protein [Acidimicrobiales bacterium]